MSAATSRYYIWGVVVPLVELPCRRSSTRGIKCQELHLGHWGEGGRCLVKKKLMEKSVVSEMILDIFVQIAGTDNVCEVLYINSSFCKLIYAI